MFMVILKEVNAFKFFFLYIEPHILNAFHPLSPPGKASAASPSIKNQVLLQYIVVILCHASFRSEGGMGVMFALKNGDR